LFFLGIIDVFNMTVDAKEIEVPDEAPGPGWEDMELKDDYVEVYKDQGDEYDIPWELLAAIHRVETGFGEEGEENTSSAGAIGPMQFMVCTWVGWEGWDDKNLNTCKPGWPPLGDMGKGEDISKEEYTDPKQVKKHGGMGVDGNGDGKADPTNLDDAIASAANKLSNDGANNDGDMDKMHEAILSYNRSDEYLKKILYFMESFGYDIDKGEKREDNGGNGKEKNDDKDEDDKVEFKSEEDGPIRAKGAEDFVDREVAKDATGVDDKSNFIGGDLFLIIQNANSNVLKLLEYLGMALIEVVAEDFVDIEVVKDAIGVDDKSNFIGGDLFLIIQNANSNLLTFLGYLGMALVALLLLFTSISVAGYLVISSNGASPGVMEGF